MTLKEFQSMTQSKLVIKDYTDYSWLRNISSIPPEIIENEIAKIDKSNYTVTNFYSTKRNEITVEIIEMDIL